MLHTIIQGLRIGIAIGFAYLATNPFYSNETYHWAATAVIAGISMTLVDIRLELSEARKPTGWFK